MIRQAATTLLVPMRGNLSRRAWSIRIASGSINSTSRLLASTTKAPPAQPTNSTSQPKFEGQEAIEKAERMHSELSEMIAARKSQAIEKPQQSFGAGFLAFLKTSKPEIVNIFFAFLCVLLAYQIHGMRAGIKKLLAAQEEKDAEIDRLRGILVTLSGEGSAVSSEVEVNGESFSMKLARKCAGAVRNIFEESEQRVGYSWILGKKLASGDAMEVERLVDEMTPIIANDIQLVVGDSAYTAEELKERRVAALKVEHEPAQNSDIIGRNLGNVAGKNDAQMGGLMEILEEVHNQDLTDANKIEESENDSTKVRRTRYAI